jgi:transcriptional regulator with XRE-family HTH domain
MSVQHVGADAAPARLAAYLRSLRRQEFTPLTQEELARVLGSIEPLGPTAISMWENPTSGRLPTPGRLTAYARLFSTARSFSGEAPRLLDDDEMIDEERDRFHQLREELLELRRAAEAVSTAASRGPSGGLWQFTDGSPVTVVCADVSEERRPPQADRSWRNYVRASSLADLDALLDLFGHLRAENPTTEVRIRAADDLKLEELRGHIALLGGEAWNRFTELIPEPVQLPVQQLRDHVRDRGDNFISSHDDRRYGPNFEDSGKTLVEDVGLFARVPNPHAPKRTLTICGGVTTRGVRGAVLCFTDPELREANEVYVAKRFPDPALSFGMLVKVNVHRATGESITPDLSRDDTALLEWVEGEILAPSRCAAPGRLVQGQLAGRS